MRIYIPGFRAMAKCNQHLDHGPIDIDLGPNVVRVVRCKDCVHWDDDLDTYGSDCGPKGKCMKSFETMCADDFCSYGDKKENE